MLRVVVCLLALSTAPMAWGECLNSAAPADDCDEDGYTPAQGDCDDEDPTFHPGAQDICDDGLDQNCNRKIDDDCDLRSGELGGGSGCGAQGGWAFFAFPLLFVRRRRS